MKPERQATGASFQKASEQSKQAERWLNGATSPDISCMDCFRWPLAAALVYDLGAMPDALSDFRDPYYVLHCGAGEADTS
ncbi:hypothetical protein HPB47_009719 [Ixodes persulcatus]|uniref:Uncharacterized protein n=1 Tax=Ixodes persulcatus TaxID=34615 RepID=A0AC60P148_IXOPE|nr:hypothetical protein HPB47_009719 [Ixodes persulcatus]